MFFRNISLACLFPAAQRLNAITDLFTVMSQFYA